MKKWSKVLQKHKKIIPVIAVIIVVGLVMGVRMISKMFNRPEQKPEVITQTTLEKMINVSEVSTFTAVYNGIAQVMNEEKPENVDYYVAYEAKVNAGFDFEKVVIEIDEESKTIHIDIPDIYITDKTVEISSLDFIFYNKKANTSTVTEEAFRACEEDVQRESEEQSAIFELAQQNARNVVKALTEPIIEQWDPQYRVVVE